MTDPLDTVTDADRARQEKDALVEQIHDAMQLARQRSPHADSYALGYAEALLAPGHLRQLLWYVERIGS